MSIIWNKLIDCQNQIIKLLDHNAAEYHEEKLAQFNQDNWINRTWVNQHIRRAHIDVVDARDSKGLWMMHVCMFPALSNDSPIYGFDVIAGSCYCWNYLTAYKTQVLTVQGHPEFTMPFFTAFLKNIKEKFDEELINKAQFSLQGNINNKKFNQLLNQFIYGNIGLTY